MMEKLKALDTRLFLYLNGHHNTFFDPIMYWASNKLSWVPLYVFLFILFIFIYRKRSVLFFVCVGLLITISDQVSSHLIKNIVKRPRPSHEPALAGLVHLSKAGPGGLYGFVSGHAANCFALFVFISLVLSRRFRWLKYVLLLWASLVSYSRIYVGVHYPGDVFCGALLGALTGYGVAALFNWFNRYYPAKPSQHLP